MNLAASLDTRTTSGNLRSENLSSPSRNCMQRVLQPELLDSLPPDHPDALHNRRDLRLTNQIVGNYRWLTRTLARVLRPGEVALELGAGTGELASQLQRSGLAVDGLDLWPAPHEWPAKRRWHRADLRTFAGYGDYPVVFGNLIFHQFNEADLHRLGEQLQGARAIIASEPARRRVSQLLYRSLGPIFGANHVSLHDAHVSIAAGFRGDELPRALGLDARDWEISCGVSLLGVYRMVAIARQTPRGRNLGPAA
jgi:hypothetical protein